MAAKRTEPAADTHPGPVTERVAANVRALRQTRGLSTYALSARLAAIGWPIHPGSITRLEAGQRRASADDLVALAITLGCSPNRLLLPPAADLQDDTECELVGNITENTSRVWAWACGDTPLPSAGTAATSGPATAIFKAENQPHRYTGVRAPRAAS